MKRKMSLVLAALAGTCAAVSSANAQLVIGNDQTSPTMWLLDVSGTIAPRALVVGAQAQVWCLAADDAGQMLYWTNGSTLFKAAYDLNNPLVPVQVGAVGAALTGLAYDSIENVLVGRASGGWYTINTTTGQGTLVNAITAQDFGGFDFDHATNAFYGTNDSTSTTVIPTGRGLYRINKPISSPTYTFLSAYPNRLDTGAPDTDIDGLAAGGGRLYLVNDVPQEGTYVWDLATSQFVAPIVPLPYTGTNGIFSGGAWAPGLFIPPTGADLSVTKVSNPTTLVVPPGGNVTYVVTVRNNGPEGAAGVVMSDTLPAGMQFVSADGGASHSAGVVSASIGAMTAGEQRTFNIVVTTNTLGSYLNTATVSGTSVDNNPGNNSASATTIVRGPQADLRVLVTDPADCSISQGGTVTYLCTLDNLGTEAAENTRLVVTLPGGTTFLSSFPALTPVGGQLTLDLGTVGVGSGGSLSINVQADIAGTISLLAVAESTTPDPNPGNNSRTETTQIIGGGPATADAVGILSTIATSPNSQVDGISGGRLSTGLTPGRPFRSPDGTKWVQVWDTDLPTAIDQIIVLGDSSGIRAVVQEGATQLPTLPGTDPTGGPYFPFGSFDAIQGINNDGAFVFSGVDSRSGTADDGYVVRGNPDGTFSLVVQENVTVAPPGSSGTFFGTLRGSAHIATNGTSAFVHNIAGLPVANDQLSLRNNGLTIVTQEQITELVGLGGTGSEILNGVTTGTAQSGFFFNADHTRYCATGTLFARPTTQDAVIIVDGTVVIQEGFTLPNSTYAETVSTFSGNRMESDGTWFARGSNAGGADWVVKNGQVVARRDAPIFAGATELYSDGPFATCFYMMLSNNNGDYVIGGTTNASNDRSNAALVLNNERVILRENDPVDLDGNGAFDDDFYIRTFIDDRAFMTDTHLYVVVRLRDGGAAFCGAADTDRGQALIRIALGTGPVPCDPDFNGDGNVDQDDIACLAQVVAGDPSCSSGDPDFNRDGNVDQDDIDALAQVVGGAPCPE